MSEYKVQKSGGKWRSYEITRSMGKVFKTLIATYNTKEQAMIWIEAMRKSKDETR